MRRAARPRAAQGKGGPGGRANDAPVHDGAAGRAERDHVALVQQVYVLHLGGPAPARRSGLGVGCRACQAQQSRL
jgi:hypothetical protein